MKFFAALFSLLASNAVAAEPCHIGAAHVAAVRESLKLEVVSSQMEMGELVLKLSGVPQCAPGLELGLEIDQELAAGFTTNPAPGAVLFARTRIEGERVRVKFTGSPEVLAALNQDWKDFRSLNRFVTGMSVRWWAYYNAETETLRPQVVQDLAGKCRPGVAAKMLCPPFSGWSFTAVPECLRNPDAMSDFALLFEVHDPFIAGQEPRVRIQGVAANLCSGTGAKSAWLSAASSAILYGGDEFYSRKTVGALSVIQVKGQIVW